MMAKPKKPRKAAPHQRQPDPIAAAVNQVAPEELAPSPPPIGKDDLEPKDLELIAKMRSKHKTSRLKREAKTYRQMQDDAILEGTAEPEPDVRPDDLKRKDIPMYRAAPEGQPGPQALNPDFYVDAICEHLRQGHFIEVAHIRAGIKKTLFYDWLAKAARHKENGLENEFTRFADAIDAAEAEGEAVMMQRISMGSLLDWKAAAWMLERRFGKRWTKTQKVELNGPNGGPISLQNVPDDVLNEQITQLTETLEMLQNQIKGPMEGPKK